MFSMAVYSGRQLAPGDKQLRTVDSVTHCHPVFFVMTYSGLPNSGLRMICWPLTLLFLPIFLISMHHTYLLKLDGPVGCHGLMLNAVS